MNRISARVVGAAVAVGAVVAGLGALLVSGLAAAAAAKPAPRVLSEARILAIARQQAARAGDRRPLLIEHAYGTRQQLNRVDSGDIVPGRTRSIMIVIVGRFVARVPSVPPGGHLPTGIEISVIENVASGPISDFGIGPRIPDLSGLQGARIDYVDRHRAGEVTGAIRFLGGAVPRDPGPRLAGVVTVFSPRGSAVTSQTVARGRRFRFFLPPGRYQLAAGRSLHSASGCGSVIVILRPGRPVHADVGTGCRIL